LGSTALVSAGVLFASVSPALAQIEVVMGGFTEFGVLAASREALRGNPDTPTGIADRGYSPFMDNELIITATGVTDTGITYGSQIEIEVGTGIEQAGLRDRNVFLDEATLFFSGAFGRLELGRDDGVEDVMFVGGRSAQAGTGGIDGDNPGTLAPFTTLFTGDVAKINYFTPRVAGFQLGATFAPDSTDAGGRDSAADPLAAPFENVWSVAGNWVGAFTGVDMTISATGIFGDAVAPGADDLADWSVGAVLGFAGAHFGLNYAQRTDANEADIFSAGIRYGFGPVRASVGWINFNPDAAAVPNQNVYIVSADMGIFPGVVVKGDISYNDDNPRAIDGPRSTWGGVVSVQMNY
jgi:outer membrane protein OmpU